MHVLDWGNSNDLPSLSSCYAHADTPKLIATKDGQLHACSWGPGLSALWTVFGRLALHAMCSFFAALT